MSQAGIISTAAGPVPPTVATSYVTNSGTAVPAANVLNVLGATVAAGSNPFRSIGSGSTVTHQIQIGQAIASTDATKIGLAAFDSSRFTVDANGFVTLNGGVTIQAYKQTAVSYQVLNTDDIIGVSSTAAPRTMTMPNSGLVTGKTWTIKDESGLAAVNNITILGNGVNIDGASSYVINTDYGAATLYYNGTQFFLI